LTTDRMMVDLDTRSLTTGKDLYYVAISRARYEATIYTNSRQELPAAISREAVKTAALDIQREREAPRMETTKRSSRRPWMGKVLSVRLSDAEEARIRGAAAVTGLSVSAYIKWLVTNGKTGTQSDTE